MAEKKIYVREDEHAMERNAVIYHAEHTIGCGILDMEEIKGRNSIADRVADFIEEGHRLICGKKPDGELCPLTYESKRALTEKFKMISIDAGGL